MTTTGKTKVAILGGGCGGVAAAFWLTSTASLRDRFEVTLYTRGWRLGGKGASGRNAAHSERIEEHGLHMWMGCYENAFRTIRACYDERRVPAGHPLQAWTDAFAPQYRIAVTQREPESRYGWRLWHFSLPKRPGTPGDGAPLVWADRLLALAGWLARQRPGVAVSLVLALIRVTTWLLQALRVLAVACAVVIRAVAPARPVAKALVLVDLVLTAAIGTARDILPFGACGFDRINAFDFRDWLSRHGARRPTVDSAPVRALYDLGFAYPGGDASNFADGRGAAGAALRFLLELGLGYKGAPLWKMNAGMGDVVFAPLYEVLAARGVRFSFFRHVARLDLSADCKTVESIVLQRQANLKAGRYEPLVRARGIDCWPSEPLWDQLADGASGDGDASRFESVWDTPSVGEEILRVGSEFDAAVVAFPPDMIRHVAPTLAEHNRAWKGMVEHSTSVATQAFQLWLRPTLGELGWSSGPTVLSAYAAPFDTWADMTHLLVREGWCGNGAPRTIAYFCGTLKMPVRLPVDPIETMTRAVQRSACRWLGDHAALLWPAFPAIAPALALAAETGPIVASYFRCNIDPSERYVQTLPGSVQHRLAPGSRPYANLYLAGDWTTTRYNSGCVEAAVESGMLAAQALGAGPIPIYGQ